ncbi:hypothetical protein, partial [uncultured Dialister sp.]|uniref:hypothetical protein n=1 Tax=uncultured Dialister sp. TaxID=278064 RepID=UPI0025D2E15B
MMVTVFSEELRFEAIGCATGWTSTFKSQFFTIQTPQKHGIFCRTPSYIEGRHESGISALARKKIG